MKRVTLLFAAFFCLLAVTVSAQTSMVKGDIILGDTAKLTILNIFPAKFPAISVVFKAETLKGEPVWNLTPDKMRVSENGVRCKVNAVEPISKNNAINIGIVFDHSGSMMDDNAQLYDKYGNELFTYDDEGEQIFPKGYIPPIANAKAAVKKFVSGFDTKKDFISIVGFSDSVDNILPLTQDAQKINSVVGGIISDGSTSLYDAMLYELEAIKQADGIKVLVVLTDGQDNSSKASWQQVVDKAKDAEIPIYMIGLGEVNVDLLKKIAGATKGQFYFTKSAASLVNIYDLISKQVQAFYDLEYESANLASADSSRRIDVSFDIDSIFLLADTKQMNLPPQVITYIKKKETSKEYFLFGGVAVVLLIGAGTVSYQYKRKQKTRQSLPVIRSLFPNPSHGMINLDYTSSAGQLNIINLNGQKVKTILISGFEKQFNLTELPSGNYIAIIQSGINQSNPMQFIILK